MAFDAGFLTAVCRELCEELSDSRLERITQCTRDTFVLEFRAAKKPRALFLSAGPSGGCCYLTERKIARPEIPPMFCMLLRKHLVGGRFLRAATCGFERVMRLDIEFVDAFGAPLLRSLFLEAMGKNSNLVLCDENGVILGALRTLDLVQNPDRPLLCGMPYLPPQIRQGSLALTDPELADHVKAAFSAAADDALSEKVLLGAVSGIAPVVAREILYDVTGEISPLAAGVDLERLCNRLAEICRLLEKGEFSFCTAGEARDGVFRVLEYCYFPLTQYGESALSFYDSPSRLLDTVAGERGARERLRVRTERAASVLRAATKRLKKKLSAQLSDLAEAENCEEQRLFGDLIMQEIWRVKRGDTCLIAVDYRTGTEHRVELDPRLSPSQNAQRYYKQYQKQKRALVSVQAQLEETKEQLLYAESVSEALERVQSPEDADEICREVSAWDYGKRFSVKETERKGGRKKVPAVSVQTAKSPGGFAVLCGKNNLQNEEITFRLANKQDLWFHAKDRPGPHVVLHLEGGRMPSNEDLMFAAKLAVSQSWRSVGCQVDYTQIKFVKHHPSRLPGRVIYSGESTIFVGKET